MNEKLQKYNILMNEIANIVIKIANIVIKNQSKINTLDAHA